MEQRKVTDDDGKKYLLSYPDVPLKPQVRRLEDTPSVFKLLRETFFPDNKTPAKK